MKRYILYRARSPLYNPVGSLFAATHKQAPEWHLAADSKAPFVQPICLVGTRDRLTAFTPRQTNHHNWESTTFGQLNCKTTDYIGNMLPQLWPRSPDGTLNLFHMFIWKEPAETFRERLDRCQFSQRATVSQKLRMVWEATLIAITAPRRTAMRHGV